MAVWVVCFVCVGSWSFEVGIVLCLSCWIPDFLRKVLKFFEILSQPSGLVGKPNHPVHWVRFSGTAVLVLCFFVLVLGHSESELHSIYFIRFLSL